MTTQNIPRTVIGKVVATPTIGYSRGGKAVVNIPIQVPHARKEGNKWTQLEPENFDVHLWQPDNLGTSKAQQWAQDVVDSLPAGSRAIAYGEWKAEREATRRDGSTMKINDLTAWSVGQDLRYGPYKAQEQAIDPMQAATTAVTEGLGGVAI